MSSLTISQDWNGMIIVNGHQSLTNNSRDSIITLYPDYIVYQTKNGTFTQSFNNYIPTPVLQPNFRINLTTQGTTMNWDFIFQNRSGSPIIFTLGNSTLEIHNNQNFTFNPYNLDGRAPNLISLFVPNIVFSPPIRPTSITLTGPAMLNYGQTAGFTLIPNPPGSQLGDITLINSNPRAFTVNLQNRTITANRLVPPYELTGAGTMHITSQGVSSNIIQLRSKARYVNSMLGLNGPIIARDTDRG